MRKNSGVYSVATPATQGLLGSETTTSYAAPSSCSALRASSTTAVTVGRPSTESLTPAKSPATRSTAGSISITRTRRIPGTSASVRAVTPLPKPITSAEAASGRAATGAKPVRISVSMSPWSDASALPFTLSVRPAALSQTDTVAFHPSRNATCRPPA